MNHPHRRAAHPRAQLAALAMATLALLAIFSLAAPAASAHAILESSSPADGAVVASSPAEVTLNFSENVTLPPGAVVVLDSAKHRVDTGNPHAGKTGSSVVVGLKAKLAKGSYLVAWHVISADSHPVQGGVVFSVGAPGPTASLSAANHAGAALEWKVADDITRGFAFAALLFLAGAAIYLGWIGTDESRQPGVARLIDVACGAGIVALALQIPFLAAQVTGQGVGSLAQRGVLGDTLRNGVGWSVLAGVVALVVLRLASTRRGVAGRVGTLVGFAGVLVSFGVVGHTRTTPPVWLALLTQLCHVGAGAVWFGGLVLLGLDLRPRRRAATPLPAGADVRVQDSRSSGENRSSTDSAAGAADDGAAAAAAIVRRFSAFATVAILTVLVAGCVLGYLEVRSLHALTTTAYGRLLLVKVFVVAVVALIGAYNHYRLLPSVSTFGRPGSPAWRRLGSTVRTEALLLVVVIAITAVLGNLVPGRTASSTAKIFSASAQFGAGSINVVVDPARVGVNQFHLYVLDREGRQVDATRSIVVQFSLPSNGLGPLTKVPLKAGPGHYQLLNLSLPLPGEWTLEITSALNEFTNNDVTFQVPIAP